MEAETEREDEELIPIEPAAKLLDLTHWGLGRRVRLGQISCIRRDGRLLFSPTDLLRALQAKKKSE